MPAPLIEFAQFAHPQRWWLRRGRPPWLDDPRWYARAFRASLVLGLMGAASGWLTIGGAVLLNSVESQFGDIQLSEFGFILGPGFWFGVGVLVPLSRWFGRGWIMTALAVPVSMLASYCAVELLFLVGPIMGNPPSWVEPYGNDAAGFFAGFAGAAILSIWMGHPLRRSAWLAGLAASVPASLYCGIFFLSPPDDPSSILPDEIMTVIRFGRLYVGFQSLTAIGLGVRLWALSSRSESATPHGVRSADEIQ